MKRRFFVSDAVRKIAKASLAGMAQEPARNNENVRQDIDAIAQSLKTLSEARRKATAISPELFREPTRKPRELGDAR